MRKLSTGLAVKQSGFTLIELIIVIIIIGILAAVAIPRLTGVTDEARGAKQQATLGALKTAWSSAYAVAKAVPSCSAIAAQMADPTCSVSGGGSGGIQCVGITKKDGTATLATFGCTGSPETPGLITCADTTAGC